MENTQSHYTVRPLHPIPSFHKNKVSRIIPTTKYASIVRIARMSGGRKDTHEDDLPSIPFSVSIQKGKKKKTIVRRNKVQSMNWNVWYIRTFLRKVGWESENDFTFWLIENHSSCQRYQIPYPRKRTRKGENPSPFTFYVPFACTKQKSIQSLIGNFSLANTRTQGMKNANTTKVFIIAIPTGLNTENTEWNPT